MATQFDQYLATLATSHRIRTRVSVLNEDETVEQDITEFVISGQVNLDTTTRPDRTAEIVILDEDHKLAIEDPNSPALGGLWAGSIIRVYYDVLVVVLGWITNPVFTGPVTNFARDGSQVTVQAQGKESFLQTPNLYDNVFSQAALNRADATRRAALSALLDAIGEPQTLVWQGTSDHLPKGFDPRKTFLAGENSYLYLANHIVGSGNQFFFDGYGTPCVRLPHPDTGIDLTPYALTAVSPTFDVTQVRNRASANVSGKTSGVEIVTIADNDPLSPVSLGRGGVNRYLDAGRSDGNFKSAADARAAATRMLVNADTVSVTFDSLPLPFVKPGDIYSITDSSGQAVKFAMETFSLGLGASDSMSIGYTRKILDPRNAHARFRKRRAKHAR